VRVSGAGGSGVEESEEGLTLRGSQGKVAVVEEEGVRASQLIGGDLFDGTTGSEEAVPGSAGVGAGDDVGLVTELIKDGEAAGLAALGAWGTYVEVDGGGEGLVAPGIEAPQREDGEMVIVADQEFTDVGGDGIEEIAGIAGIAGSDN
jgi:hypothetical protein